MAKDQHNKNGRSTRYLWSDEALALAQTGLRLTRAERSVIVTKIVTMTGYPRLTCARFVQRLGGDKPRVHYIWSPEVSALAKAKRGASRVERKLLVSQIVAMTGYPWSICRRFVCKTVGPVQRKGQVWPQPVVELILARRNEEKIWPLVVKVSEMTGYAHRICWDYVRTTLGLKRGTCRRWSKEVHDLARKNPNATGEEFDTLLAEVMKMTGYHEERCRRFIVHSLAHRAARRYYVWPREVRELVRQHRGIVGAERRLLLNKVMEMTEYPKVVCRRFLVRMGIKNNRPQRKWSSADKRKLARLLGKQPLGEIARQLRRSQYAVRSMLSQMGLSVRVGRDWFTVAMLSRVFRVQSRTIQVWIDRGILPQTELGTKENPCLIITSKDVCQFCKDHMEEILKDKVDPDQLDFIRQFVFPSRHLTVRETKEPSSDPEE